MAERVGRYVDAAAKETVALHRREGSVVADDLGDRIRRRHWHPRRRSYEMQGSKSAIFDLSGTAPTRLRS
jgi:hypothetical protein